MIIHKCDQGSAEWLKLRAGIPTASCFDMIVTPGGKASEQAKTYLHKLIAERIMGHPLVEHVSFWMDRGTECEAEAVNFYELQSNNATERVGFITNEAGTVGASPDRLIVGNSDGIVEIKVPAPHTHVGYLLGVKTVDKKYWPQVQGQLWISERKWADVLSYHPEMPPALIRVERDEEFISKLEAAVMAFSAVLEEHAARLKEDGVIGGNE